MISASKIFKDYQQEELAVFKKEKWTAVHTLMSIGYGLLALICFVCILIIREWEVVLVFLACVLIFAVSITLGIKFCMPYFMKEAEYENNRRNKLLSMVQEEYEYKNLAEKTSIGILEKYTKAIIEEEARSADAHRQQEVKKQEYNSKVADITCDLFKAYSSAQSPQATSDQQIVYQLIQSLINNSK